MIKCMWRERKSHQDEMKAWQDGQVLGFATRRAGTIEEVVAIVARNPEGELRICALGDVLVVRHG